METTNKICATPLAEGDFGFYDGTPDDRLFANELTEEKLACFVQRYLQTDDRDIRSSFRNRMENSVWEACQARLEGLKKQNNLKPPLKERLETILEKEFPPEPLQAGNNVEWEHQTEEERNDAKESHYSLLKAQDTLSGSGWLTLKLPFNKDWKLNAILQLDGRHHRQEQQESTPENSIVTEESFKSFQVMPNTTLLTRDDSFQWNVNGFWNQFINSPSDHLKRARLLGSSLNLRDISLWGNTLTAAATGSYNDTAYEPPPPQSDFFQQRGKIETVTGEITYRFSSFGIVTSADFSRTDSGSHYSIDDKGSLSGSLLAQYTSDKDYIRGGFGFGQWSGANRFLGSTEGTQFEGQELHSQISGQWGLHENFRLEALGHFQMNESEGDIVGWYPSWRGETKLVFSPKHWTATLSTIYGGYHIDLNEQQDLLRLENALEIAYRPSDHWILKLTPKVAVTQIDEFENMEQLNWNLQGSLNHNPSFWKALWLWAYGGRYTYDYSDFRNNQFTGGGWWAGVGASLNY